MTELETNATTSTRKVTFPDVTGTPVFSINGITPNTSTGNAVLDFYTTSQVYTKAEVDAITGAGGGVAGVTTFNGRTGTVVPTTGDYTKSMVGLGNVDNTSDASKPISTATQTALDLKAPIASPTFTGTVSGITKAMVGLTNVDNTSDAAKPVSTATATALALKVDKVTGKSLILDTEITRLGTLRNTVITQGTNVTITGTGTSGDPYVINSTGGSSGSNIINVAGGTNTVSITGGTLIDTIVVDAPTSTTFKMGYTSGAEDVVSSTSVSGVQPINVTEYTKTTQTYYFTKASDTALKIYTR